MWDVVSSEKKAKVSRSQLEVIWEEIARKSFPRMPNAERSSLDLTYLAAEDQYDGSFRNYLLDHANGFHGMVFPVNTQTTSLKPPKEFKDSDVAVKFYNEAAEELEYQKRRSNYSDVAHRCILERITFGTCGILIEEDKDDYSSEPDGLNFRDFNVNSYSIQQDHRGRVSEVYTVLEYSPEDAASEWGKDNLPEKIRVKLGKNSDKKDRYIVGFKRVKEWDDEQLKKDAEGKPFVMKVVLAKGKQDVVTQGFHEFPFAFSRYLTITGNPYGFSPSFFLLPEARRLVRQQEIADQMGLAALSGGPLVALNKLKGRINRGVNQITYVESMGDAPASMLTTNPSEYQVGLTRIDNAKEDMKKALNIDFFQLFSNLDDPNITATVGRYLKAEQASNQGSPYTRFMNEFVEPVDMRAFKILYRQGKLPEVPDELVVGNDKKTGLKDFPMPEAEFSNQIVEALETSKVLALQEWMQGIGLPLFEADPKTAVSFNFDHIAKNTFRVQVGDEDAIRSEKEVADSLKEIQEQQQQEQQLAQAREGAAVAKDASTAGVI